MSIFGQTKSDSVNLSNIKYNYAVGVSAGFTTGYGLSFKFIPNKLGFQTTFCPFYDVTHSKYNLGFSFLYNIIEKEFATFYLYQGNHLIFSQNYSDYIKHLEINNGIGIGIEGIWLRHISFNLMYGCAFYDNFDRFFFTAETGIYYKF